MIRFASSSNTVHFKKINKNLGLLHKQFEPERPRPLVLLFAWLAAKGKHKKKYADFYLNKGFDVLHVSIQADQLLWPTRGQQITRQVVDLLQTDHVMRHQQILTHAFSVGAYLYTECLVQFTDHPRDYTDVEARIRGHVFDSPVGPQGIAEGVPKALTKNKTAIRLSRAAIQWYLDTFQEKVTRHFDRAMDEVLVNRLAVPTLFFYSHADPVGTAKSIEYYIRTMESHKNAPIYNQSWEKSPHVSHMLYHPQEYIATLNRFLDSIGIMHQSQPQLEQVAQ